MLPLSFLKTSRFDQLPLSSEESPNISLNKTQDDKYTESVCKTKNVPIMGETISQSSRSPSKPQEEGSRASQTVEQKVFYTVEERNDLTSMSKGSNDNSVNHAVVNIDSVDGMLYNSANTSSQYNISSAEGTEPNSDNNYGHDGNVSSSLENNTVIFDKMDNSSSLDTISNNSSHICSQPPTNVTRGGKPSEDTIEKQDPVEGSETNDAGIVEDIYTDSFTSGSDDNSLNFALDDNNTVGCRLDERANASSSQMLKNHTSVRDKIGNDLLLNTRSEDSSHFISLPHANVTVDSGLHEDTLEFKKNGVTGLENNLTDNSSLLATFEIDKTKGKKYSHESQDENNEPTISKADKEQNAVFLSQNVIENKYIATSRYEDDNPTNSGFANFDTVNSKLDNCESAGSRGNPISAEGTELNKTTYEHDKGICSSQAENNISRASETEEQNVLSTDHDTIVIEKESAASLSQGSNDNSVNHAVVNIDSVDGMLYNSANTSSQYNISSAEGTEPNSDNNYGHNGNVSSSLENHTVIFGKMDNSSSLDTISNNSSHICSQPPTNVTRGGKPSEDTIEKQDPVEGSQTNDAGIVEDIYTDSFTSGSDGNSSNFALDDNNTVGCRLDESANASSSQMLNHTSVRDKIGNDLLLNTRSEDSSHFISLPHANVTVDSGPHEDTLELTKPGVTGLENNLTDNSSMLGTFDIDKTKGKKYSHESQDENNEPTISKADKEQNAVFVSQNVEVIENKYLATSSYEDDNPTNSGFVDSDTVNSKLDNCESAGSRGNPISAEDTELNKTTYEHDKGICSSQAENNISRASETEEQNVLDHDTIVIEKESAASSSQGSNGNSNNWTVLDDNYTVGVKLDNCTNTSSQDNIREVESGGNCEHGMDTSSSQVLKSCTSMVDKTDTSSSLNTRSNQPYPNVTVDSELHEGYLERQKPDVGGREFHATDEAVILPTSENDNIKNEKLYCESQGKMVPISLKTEQEVKELAETNDENISYGSQDEQRPRGFKTKEEERELNVGPNITKMKNIDYSNHASNAESANFSDAVVDRVGNSTNEGRRANAGSPEDTELDKNDNCEHEIKIQSNQEVINATSMNDKMESNFPLDTKPNKSFFFSNQSYASAIEDSELHEDTIEEQKPVVRDSESLVESRTFTNLELPQVPKINNTNTDTFLGNGVDFKASETQTLDNYPFVGNQFNCFSSSDTLHMVAASVLKASKKQKKSGKSQNTDDATRQSTLKRKMKIRRQKSQKPVRKSNIQEKSARVLQPKRGEKAFNETNREKRTPITYTPQDGARTFKENSSTEKEIVTRMDQSIESIRLMGSEKLKGSWAAVVKWLVFLWLFQNFLLPVYELFTHKQVMAKVDQYEGGDGPQARAYLQSTMTPNGTTSKPLDRPTWSRIFGALPAILVILVLVALLTGYFVKRCRNKTNNQSPTTNGIELHNMKKDGEDTNEGLLSNGTSEPQHKNQMAET
ncbi:uncharacterized protein LOC143933535 isoform X2 [Lithobates pipiens]